jgi:hypothetical protein
MYHLHRHRWEKNPYWTIAFLRRFCHIWSGLQFFGFPNIYSFIEQGHQPVVHSTNPGDHVSVFISHQ